MMHDEEIQAVRKIRHEISAQFGHDVHKVVAYYRAIEDELKRSGEFRFAEAPNDERPSPAQLRCLAVPEP
jgi:hypothetical protein